MSLVRADDGGAEEVLAAERDHLATSRDFLRLMREDVLSLPALAGDPVSQEYLKADLYRRAEALKDLPDTPLFFGRLDYEPGRTRPAGEPGEAREYIAVAAGTGESFHVGRRHVHDQQGHPVVIDWRAPVSRPFYRASPSDPMGLVMRRRFGFSGGELTAFEDEVFEAAPTAPEGDGQPGQAPLSRIRIDARHRRDDPAGAGRHRACRCHRICMRARGAWDREDRGRPASRCLFAL